MGSSVTCKQERSQLQLSSAGLRNSTKMNFRHFCVLLLVFALILTVYCRLHMSRDTDGDGLKDHVNDYDDDNDGILDIHDEDDDGDGILDTHDEDWHEDL